MQSADRARAADLLMNAYRTRVPIPPPRASFPDMTPQDAYEIQLLQLAQWEANGSVLRGHKVGLTSAAMQQQLGVDQPDYGVLLDGMFLPASSPLDATRFLQPRIEPEIAFVLQCDLSGPGITGSRAAAAVDYVVPALEIIDSRVAGWDITIVNTIADNASSGGVVLGDARTRLDDLDLARVACTLFHGDRAVANGTGDAVLGSPLHALVWLANTLGELGVSLRAGHVVLPGSVTAAQPVRPGDVWTADFAGLGNVSAAFEDPHS